VHGSVESCMGLVGGGSVLMSRKSCSFGGGSLLVPRERFSWLRLPHGAKGENVVSILVPKRRGPLVPDVVGLLSLLTASSKSLCQATPKMITISTNPVSASVKVGLCTVVMLFVTLKHTNHTSDDTKSHQQQRVFQLSLS
jgi:hypothetical protein